MAWHGERKRHGEARLKAVGGKPAYSKEDYDASSLKPKDKKKEPSYFEIRSSPKQRKGKIPLKNPPEAFRKVVGIKFPQMKADYYKYNSPDGVVYGAEITKNGRLYDNSTQMTLTEANTWLETHELVKKDYRLVYGTRDGKWHRVNYSDRDYADGLTQAEFNQLGEKGAREKYLGAKIIKPSGLNKNNVWKKIIDDEWLKSYTNQNSSMKKGSIYYRIVFDKKSKEVRVYKHRILSLDGNASAWDYEAYEKVRSIEEGNNTIAKFIRRYP